MAVQPAHLVGGEQAVDGQLGPGAAQARGTRHPDHHLQVAQAAGALLAVGLQRVRRVLVLHVPLQHLQRLGAQEGLGVERVLGGLPELPIDAALAAEEARLEHRRLHRHVGARLGDAFVDAAHRRADLQPHVPAGGDETLDRRAQRLVRRRHVLAGVVGQQHQHVDVGVRVQLAAAVATHRHQRRAGRHLAAGPQLAQCRVHVPRERARQPRRGRRRGARLQEVPDQRVLAVAELRAQGADTHCAALGLFDRGGHAFSPKSWLARRRWWAWERPTRWRRRRRIPGSPGCRPTASSPRSRCR